MYIYMRLVWSGQLHLEAETGETTWVNTREISYWSERTQDVQDQGLQTFRPESWSTHLLFLIAPEERSGIQFQCGQGAPSHLGHQQGVLQFNSDSIYLERASDSSSVWQDCLHSPLRMPISFPWDCQSQGWQSQRLATLRLAISGEWDCQSQGWQSQRLAISNPACYLYF